MAHSTNVKSNVISYDPYKLFATKPLWAHATSSKEHGRIICTAGQVGADENNVVPPNIDDEIALAFENLRRCLEAAGASVTDILKLVYYIVDFDESNRPHSKHLVNFLNGHRPTTTLVPVMKLARHDYHFEIEAIASIPVKARQEVDVVVVGAGLSGLSAAYEVQKAGMSVIVAEARDRVGGKTHSVQPLGDARTIDLGAAWINDSTQRHVFELAQALGLRLVKQNTIGKVVQEDLDGSLSTFEYGTTPEKIAEAGGLEDMLKLRNLADSLSQTLDLYNAGKLHKDLDRLTMEEWVKQHCPSQTALASAEVWTRAMLGLELSEVGALACLNYFRGGGGLNKMRSDLKDGGQYLRFANGSQQLSHGLAGLLHQDSIMLKSPVQKIEQNSGKVLVSTARGEILCSRVIVTVPTPLYHLMDFSPPLPPAKLELSSKTTQGYTNKVMLMYDTPWWRTAGLCGLLQSFSGPITVSRDSSVDEAKQFSLTCFTVGQPGVELSKLTQRERFEIVERHVASTFGKFVDVPKPVAVLEYEWSKDQWAQGCPCPVAPAGDVMTQLEGALRTPHDKVHFAGTETAYEWKGYMDGAISSGKRAAQEVITALTRPKL